MLETNITQGVIGLPALLAAIQTERMATLNITEDVLMQLCLVRVSF